MGEKQVQVLQTLVKCSANGRGGEEEAVSGACLRHLEQVDPHQTGLASTSVLRRDRQSDTSLLRNEDSLCSLIYILKATSKNKCFGLS